MADGDNDRCGICHPMIWLWLILIASAVVALFVWQLIVAEGTYLGPRMVAWTYDCFARRYDSVKQFDAVEESRFVARPLLAGLMGRQRPLVLDVATGTGRVPQALLRERFDGRIVGLDLSRGMLRQARAKLESDLAQVDLIWQDARHLPFDEGVFDAVVCLESLEFLPQPQRALAEMIRVLAPSGLLLVTNRVGREARLLPRRAIPRQRLAAVLASFPLKDLEVWPWQVNYDLVLARKLGPTCSGRRERATLPDLLRCPGCDGRLESEGKGLACQVCARLYPIRDGIICLAGPIGQYRS
jgi:ubiquinone/menaquinone biosynthesis C-methylase UbiE